MTLRLILGVDPGQTGAIAILADGEPAGFLDMPIAPRLKGGGQLVDGARLAASVRGILLQHVGAHVLVVLERVQPIGGRGSQLSGFRFGQADGVVRGVVGALGLQLLEVEPQQWKRHHGLLKTEKDVARQMAMSRWPRIGASLMKVLHGGRADALLVATWAHETEAWIPVEPAARVRRPTAKRTERARPAVPA